MIKHVLAVVVASLSLSALAADNSQNANSNTNTKPFNGTTGNAAVDGTKHRSDKKTLKAYCEKQAKQQNLGSKQKTEAAIANCEKS